MLKYALNILSPSVKNLKSKCGKNNAVLLKLQKNIPSFEMRLFIMRSKSSSS